MEPLDCWMILIMNSAAGFLQLLTFCSKCQELGVQAPVGYWDPAGLAKDGDVETFKRRCLQADGWTEVEGNVILKDCFVVDSSIQICTYCVNPEYIQYMISTCYMHM